MRNVPDAGTAGQSLPVLIIDDHELFAVSLVFALGQIGLLARRARLDSPDSIIESARESDAGVAVLDLHLGAELDTDRPLLPVPICRSLIAAGWRVLVVSGSRDEEAEAAVIAAGAAGSVPKSSSFDDMVAAIELATSRRVVMSPSEKSDWLYRNAVYAERRRRAKLRMSRLSRRENEVLELMVAGQRAAQIAEHFVVSLTTVRTQIRSILSKLECGSQLEAVAVAHRWSVSRDY